VNWGEIENGLKYVERIEKGESELQRLAEIDMAIEEKFRLVREQHLESKLKESEFINFGIDDIDLIRRNVSNEKKKTHGMVFPMGN